MSKAAIYTSNSVQQTITGGGPVNLGTAVHGFGRTCCARIIDLSGGNLVFREGGMYSINISATVTDTAAATVTLTVFQDGATVTTAAETVDAANDAANIAIATAIRVPDCGSSTVAVVITTDAGNPIVGNINAVAVKL